MKIFPQSVEKARCNHPFTAKVPSLDATLAATMAYYSGKGMALSRAQSKEGKKFKESFALHRAIQAIAVV